jgi:class 3 adenylate cyclase
VLNEGPILQARFSLNVGEVTIGVIGSSRRRSIALIGPAVNLASRLLKYVSPNGIIAPQAAVERLRQEAPTLAHDFQLRGACLIVRGFEEQCVTAYHLAGEAAALSPWEVVASDHCAEAVAAECRPPPPAPVEQEG